MTLASENVLGIKKLREDLWKTDKISATFAKMALFYNIVIKVKPNKK